jgi:hypothetical protein
LQSLRILIATGKKKVSESSQRQSAFRFGSEHLFRSSARTYPAANASASVQNRRCDVGFDIDGYLLKERIGFRGAVSSVHADRND